MSKPTFLTPKLKLTKAQPPTDKERKAVRKRQSDARKINRLRGKRGQKQSGRF